MDTYQIKFYKADGSLWKIENKKFTDFRAANAYAEKNKPNGGKADVDIKQ